MERSQIKKLVITFLGVWTILCLTFLIYILITTKQPTVGSRDCKWVHKWMDSFLGYGGEYSSQNLNGIKTCKGVVYTSTQRAFFLILLITLGSLTMALATGVGYGCVVMKTKLGKRSQSQPAGIAATITTTNVSFQPIPVYP